MRASETNTGARSVGFTLLEVLAAVAVLALIYSALSGLAIQGLRNEGETARRLEASLLADQILSEIEAGLDQGVAPDLGRSEDERDGFEVIVEVSAYDIPLKRDTPKSPQPTLLATGVQASMLRRIDIDVSWQEGIYDRHTGRTSFGLDFAAAAGLLEQLLPDGDAETTP